jgi:hypothetical protein
MTMLIRPAMNISVSASLEFKAGTKGGADHVAGFCILIYSFSG